MSFQNGGLVLLVDGSVDERERWAEHLRMRGFLTLESGTPADGYQVATTQRPDVVITAMTIVEIGDGLTLVQRLKTDEQTKHVPVIILPDWCNANAANGTRSMSKLLAVELVANVIAELLNGGTSQPQRPPT